MSTKTITLLFAVFHSTYFITSDDVLHDVPDYIMMTYLNKIQLVIMAFHVMAFISGSKIWESKKNGMNILN